MRFGTPFTPEKKHTFFWRIKPRDPFHTGKSKHCPNALRLRPISQRKDQPYSKRNTPRDLFHIGNADSHDGTCCLETCLDKAASEVSEANFIPRKPSVSATAQAIAGAPGTTKR